jgi:membrane fusion protein, multidrug efflux system
VNRKVLYALFLINISPTFAQSPTEPMLPVQLVAIQHTQLSAELAAKIDLISVKEGERFTSGQVLVKFDCSIQQSYLEEARAVLSSAEKILKAHKRLLELNSTGTLDVEKASSEATVARAKVNSSKAVIAKCQILAPFAGRVVERKVQTHQYVQAGESLLEILDDSSLEAEFIVPSLWGTHLAIGTGVEVFVDETQKTYPGVILRTGARVEAVSHSLKVIATIKGHYPELMAGMSGKARIIKP